MGIDESSKKRVEKGTEPRSGPEEPPMDRGWVKKKPGRDAQWRGGKNIARTWLQCSHFHFPHLTYPTLETYKNKIKLFL